MSEPSLLPAARRRFRSTKSPQLADASICPTGADAHPRDRRGVAPLETAGPDDLAYMDNASYAEALGATRAGACLVSPRFAGRKFRRAPSRSSRRSPTASSPRSWRVLFPFGDAARIVLRRHRHFARLLRPSDGAARARRDGRSGRGRSARSAEIGAGTVDRRPRRDRPAGPDRPRLLDRRQRDASRTPSSATASSSIRACASGRTASASPWARKATSRCRRSAGSSSRTTSRSAPTPRSTAAPAATP